MVNINLLFGPMLMGVFLNMVLYGVLLTQTYHYYQTYKKDSTWLKFFVLYIFIIESVNSACDVAMMYQPLIQKFGLPDATKFFPTLFSAEPLAIVCVSFPIQLFFAWRVKQFTKSNILPIIIFVLGLTSFAGGIWTTVLLIKIKVFARKPELHYPALVWFLAATVADILISVVMVINLLKRRTGFVATDNAIAKMVRLTVQTGMVTAIFAVGDVIFFMTLPHTALNFIWDLALSKLYANCLMSTLNARASLLDTSNFSQQRNISSSAQRRHEIETDNGNMSIFELESQKVYNRDLDFGVQITKIVETRKDTHFDDTQ